MLSDMPVARQALRKLLVDRIAFQPEEANGTRAYRMRWSIVTKPVLEASSYIGMASPGGTTLDASLGTLPLEWRVAA